MSLVRCKPWNLFPILTPDVSISPHSPHPRYNELDGVSYLQTGLSPNRLRGLEALCECPDTNLLPFSRAWEVCFTSRLIHTQGDRAFVCKHSADPFPNEYMELGDTMLRPVTDSASWESVVFQCKASVIMHWLRGSCPRLRERWSEEGGKYTDFNIGKTFRHLFLASIMNNMSHSIMFEYMLNPYSRHSRC